MYITMRLEIHVLSPGIDELVDEGVVVVITNTLSCSKCSATNLVILVYIFIDDRIQCVPLEDIIRHSKGEHESGNEVFRTYCSFAASLGGATLANTQNIKRKKNRMSVHYKSHTTPHYKLDAITHHTRHHPTHHLPPTITQSRRPLMSCATASHLVTSPHTHHTGSSKQNNQVGHAILCT